MNFEVPSHKLAGSKKEPARLLVLGYLFLRPFVL